MELSFHYDQHMETREEPCLWWKKKDVSQMYVLDTHSLDIRHLTQSMDMCVFMELKWQHASKP